MREKRRINICKGGAFFLLVCFLFGDYSCFPAEKRSMEVSVSKISWFVVFANLLTLSSLQNQTLLSTGRIMRIMGMEPILEKDTKGGWKVGSYI